jgi:hypothetical protein
MILFKIYLVLSVIMSILYGGFLIYCAIDDKINGVRIKAHWKDILGVYIYLLLFLAVLSPAITIFYLVVELLTKLVNLI